MKTILMICLVLFMVEVATDVLEDMGLQWWIMKILQIFSVLVTGIVVSYCKQQTRGDELQIAIHTGKSSNVVEKRREKHRLEKDFMPTATSKKSIRVNAITLSVRDNIRLIERDLIVSDSSLLDELQMEGYLSEEEIKVIKSHSRKDQTHLFAEYIARLDNHAFLSVLSILKNSAFGHIADRLHIAYMRHLSVLTPASLCVVCRIKEEVDIKELRCDLLEKDFITSSLYSDINACKRGKGHQNVLWDQLYFHLNKLIQKDDDVIKVFLNFFDTPRHRGLFYHLQKKKLFRLICFCNHTESRLEKDFIKIADTYDTGEDSNTPSLPVPIEPDWYREAANSSSSDGISATELKTIRKRQCSGDTLNRKTVSRKKLKPTGSVYTSWKMQSAQKDSEEDTSSIDSNPGSNLFKLSKLSPSRTDSTSRITRKRRETSNLKQEISLTVSSNPSESETELKSSGKKPRICLMPYISDSDFNTDGESLKTYTLPKNATYRKCDENSLFPGDFIPTAFAKTKISTSESQIW